MAQPRATRVLDKERNVLEYSQSGPPDPALAGGIGSTCLDADTGNRWERVAAGWVLLTSPSGSTVITGLARRYPLPLTTGGTDAELIFDTDGALLLIWVDATDID